MQLTGAYCLRNCGNLMLPLRGITVDEVNSVEINDLNMI